MHKYLGALSMDVICACAYGIKINSIANPDHPVVHILEKILCVDNTLSMLTSILFPRLAKLLRLNFYDPKVINELDKLINRVIMKRQENGSGKKNEHDSFI